EKCRGAPPRIRVAAEPYSSEICERSPSDARCPVANPRRTAGAGHRFRMPLDSEHFRFTPRTLRARRGSLRVGETAGRDGRLLPTIATGGEGVRFRHRADVTRPRRPGDRMRTDSGPGETI